MPTTPPSITTLPAAPDPNNRTTFNSLAYPWSAALPTFGTEVSAVATNVKANADEAEADAVATAADRVVTTADRIAAAASASTATTQASNASTSASTATTQAGIATTKAGEANASAIAAAASAASIAGGPVASVNGMTGVVTGIATGSGTANGTNTGDQTITLTGGVTGSGTGSFAATVVTNANLTGEVTSVGNAATLTNSAVIGKVLTGYVSGAGTVAATDTILQAVNKLNGNDAAKANIASPTFTGTVGLPGYTETVYTLAGTVIDVANGTIQTKTLAANTTFTESLADGQSVMLGITAGAYSVTWPTTVWAKVGGSGVAPTLRSTGVNWVILWQTGGTLRGSFLGTT